MSEGLEQKIETLRQRDRRYARTSYVFVLEALDYTLHRLSNQRDRHVGGRELLEGIRDFGRERYGAMAKEVFHHWGVRCTEDFGQIVFNMIGIGLLQQRPQDSLQDFANGYDFTRVFEAEYRLASTLKG